MRGRLWLNYFVIVVGKKDLTERDVEAWQWTEFLGKIMDEVGKKKKCNVVRRRIEPEDKKLSGEYLNIDVLFIDDAEYDLSNEGRDPFVLPRAVVELENKWD